MNNDIKPHDAELNEQELDQVVGGYRYKLQNVSISSYSVSGGTQDNPMPTETLSLNFEEVKVTY